jgi:Transposase Tn5 dimerisation domain
VLSEAEWKILYCSIHPGKSVPVQPPRMDEAVKWIARLGGFLNRKGDGFPGPITLWRGLQRLHDLCSGSAIANQLHNFVGNA